MSTCSVARMTITRYVQTIRWLANSIVHIAVSFVHVVQQAESAFKGLAVAIRQAIALDASAGVPSTKGVLS